MQWLSSLSLSETLEHGEKLSGISRDAATVRHHHVPRIYMYSSAGSGERIANRYLLYTDYANRSMLTLVL